MNDNQTLKNEKFLWLRPEHYFRTSLSISSSDKMPPRVHCCMRRVDPADNRHCKRRIETWQRMQRVCEKNGRTLQCCKMYYGMEYKNDDYLCSSCHVKVASKSNHQVKTSASFNTNIDTQVRSLDPTLWVKQSPAVPPSPAPRKLRSGLRLPDSQPDHILTVPPSRIRRTLRSGFHLPDSQSTASPDSHAVTQDVHSNMELSEEDSEPTTQSSTTEILSIDVSQTSSFSQDFGIQVDEADLQDASSQASRRSKGHITLPGIKSVACSSSLCFICRSTSGRSRIPKTALLDLWLKTQVMVPSMNRVCKSHLEDDVFTSQAIDQIAATRNDANVSGHELAEWLKTLTLKLLEKRKPLDFDKGSGLTDADYKLLTGISEEAFSELAEILAKSEMRNSGNRSHRNALGIFMVMLRLGLSQRVLRFLFGVRNQSCISDTIDKVAEVLMKEFVPKHLGYTHMEREELMSKHMRPIYTKVLERDDDDLILVLDGTYLYVEQSSDHYLQRRSYSSHKHRSLFKPMMVVLPSGYVLEAEGLYFADGRNNDSGILKHMLCRGDDSILQILQTRDVLLLDRGFQRAIDVIESTGVHWRMPEMIDRGQKQKQFTSEQANKTRKVTKLRWVVELANGRLKNVFKFFASVIPTGYFRNLRSFLRIALAIQNAFFPPLFTESEVHTKILERIEAHDDDENTLQTEIEENELNNGGARVWDEADEDSILEFPKLTYEDLVLLTLGEYQLRVGRLYNREHLASSGGYRFFVHKERDGLIRAQMQSRFRNQKRHKLWIEFDETGSDYRAITRWFCKCESGARTLGMCSHVSAVSCLYFACRLLESLSYCRHIGHPILVLRSF